MKIYCNHENPRLHKNLIAAAYAGQNLEHCPITMPELKSPEMLKLNPNGKMPILVTPDGPIYESKAMLRHLGRLGSSANLYGSSSFEQAQVDQWLDFCTTEVEPVMAAVIYPLWGFVKYCPERNKKAMQDLNSTMKQLENHLKVNNFMVGNNVTIADIDLCCMLSPLFKFVFVEKQRKSNFPSVTKWFEHLTSQQQFKNVVGTTRLCVKEMPQQGLEEAKAAQKEQKKQKEAQPKKEVKKEEKPKKEEKEEEAFPEKKKNPLDCLPETKFNLFDYKTLFVNAKDKQEALQFLWDNFDNNGFSFWKITYQKYEGEGEKVYLTANLYNGFIQRLDHFRKYAFGVHGVYGDEPKLEVQGVWLWRGTEMPQEMKDNPQYEYHTYERLDVNNQAHKQLISDYWTKMNFDTDVVEGMTVRDVKYFK